MTPATPRPARSPARRLAAALASLALAACGPPEPPAPPPSIVLISLDTLRPDRLSGYGYVRPTSPVLDELAARSAVFTRARCQSVGTLTSHLSLMTSLYPLHLQITRLDGENDNMMATNLALPEQVVTLAEVLSAGGYETAAFTGGGFVAADWGLGQGFSSYHESESRFQGLRESMSALRGFLESRPESRETPPLFLFLHTFDIHEPYFTSGPLGKLFSRENFRELGLRVQYRPVPSVLNERLDTLEEGMSEALSDFYDNGIRETDLVLKQLFRLLDDHRLFDDAIVVVLSDHGEEFLEHGRFNHGPTVFEELVRVPLLIRRPQGRGGGRVVDAPVALLDVAPTLLDLAGIPMAEQFQGRSLTGLLEGGDEAAFWERSLLLDVPDMRTGVHGMIRGDWKIASRDPDGLPRLFDLAVNPRELAEKAPPEELTARWLDEMRVLRAAVALAGSTRGWTADPAVDRRRGPLTEKAREQLGALGYVE